MAVSTIAGDFGGGIQMTCILAEGVPTVSTASMTGAGAKETTYTFATPMSMGEIVAISAATENTYISTKGLPVVKIVANGEFVIGRVISEPRLVRTIPNTAAGDTWAKALAGEYYRVATVEIWGGITAIQTATLVTTDTAAVTPGLQAGLTCDVSRTNSDKTLCLNDLSSGGVGFYPFHYCAKLTAADYTILVGIMAPTTAAT